MLFGMTDDRPDRRSPFWPLNWLRDERFWRDMAVQVTGTGAVALIVFLWATAAGYLSPTGSDAGFRTTMFVLGIVIAVLALVMLLLTIGSAREMQRREGGRAGLRYTFGLGFLFLVILSPLVVPWVIAVTTDRPFTLFG